MITSIGSFTILPQPILFGVLELLFQLSRVSARIWPVSVQFALFLTPTLARSGMNVLVGHRVVLNFLLRIHFDDDYVLCLVFRWTIEEYYFSSIVRT